LAYSLKKPMGEMSTASTIEALQQLATMLGAIGLQLDLTSAPEARAAREELITRITGYLVPRLARLDAPPLVVVGGSTGSGKSTIVNSLIGAEVSAAGVLRPTTRTPVLVCHPDDAVWFSGDSLLPGTTSTGTPLRVVSRTDVDPGLGLVDTPGIDSVEPATREVAGRLLAAADLWLLTTTAVRYADAVPWELLHRARQRGTALAIAINRIPPGAGPEIEYHLRRLLADEGLQEVPIHTIDQVGPGELVAGRLPATAVGSIDRMLMGLVVDVDRRAAVVAQTLKGALADIDDRARLVAVAADTEHRAATALSEAAGTTYARSTRRLGAEITGGTLLRGEALDRWQELIGSTELAPAVRSRIRWARARLARFVTRSPAAAQVGEEIVAALEQVLIDHADAAALAVCDRWRSLPGGRQVLGGDPSLGRVSDAFRSDAGSEVRAWQDQIIDLVRSHGRGERSAARTLALGADSIGMTLVIALLSRAGGLDGEGSTLGSHTLLTALLGEQAAQNLVAEGRRMLLDRVDRLFESDAERFRAALAEATTGGGEQADDLVAALKRFQHRRSVLDGQR
jgi:energy-coupling factor transporter ATP-binding protein EcfA2